MALVDYSDSDGSEEQYTTSTSKASVNNSAIGPLKRKRDESVHANLPPLPSSFHDLYASNARVSTQDDPGLHGGRPRAMPHVEGNWPTHAYIEWYPSQTESEHLSTLLASLEGDPRPSNGTIQSLLKNEIDAEMPLHVSLSRPLVLATDQRSPFVGMLKDRISRSGARPFCIGVRELEWVSNDEKTRWFLVLKLTKPPNDDLNKLLHVVNQAASSFGKALLYAEPRTAVPYQHNSAQGSKRRTGAYRTLRGSSSSVSANPASDLSGHFHMSIGWSLNAPNSSVLERSRSADLFNIHNLRLVVQAVKVKVGNAVTSIPLPTRMEETRGIIENVMKPGHFAIDVPKAGGSAYTAAHECVSEEALVHLKSYKYSSVDNSLISKYILRHYWNAFVEILPLWLAPNMVTLLGFFFILANVICLEIFIPDLVGPGPSWLYYSFALGLWMYSTMDNVDGKQARRTAQSSGLGELFDHGIDSLNCTLASLCETAAMGLGPSRKGAFTALVPCLPMFFSTWETYHTHTLYLGYFNGPTEGLILACSIMILSGYYGPDIWTNQITDFFGHPEIFSTYSVIDVWIPILIISFLVAHLPACISNVAKARRAQGLPLAPLFLEWTPMVIYTASCGAWLYSPYSTLLQENRLVLFCITMSFVFGRMTTKIILAHLTKQPFPYWTIMLAPLVGGAVLANLPRLGFPAMSALTELWYLRAYFVFAMVVYFRWALLVINSICAYLGINCLTITNKPAPNQNLNEKQSLNGTLPNGSGHHKGE